MSILKFYVPTKIHSTEEHNKTYSSDSEIAGTYVPNMSEKDMYTWKGKHIKGDNERVEIRKTFDGVQGLIVVYKNESMKISFNGSAKLNDIDWKDFIDVVREAKGVMK